MKYLNRPTSEWPLRALEVGAAVAAQGRDEAVARGDRDMAAALQRLTLAIAEDRDARRGLRSATAEAIADGLFATTALGIVHDD